jgi:ATP-dependent RNA helicase DDX19/DBP5
MNKSPNGVDGDRGTAPPPQVGLPSPGKQPTPTPDGEKKDDGESEISAAEKSYLTKLLRSNLVSTKNDVEVQRSNPDSPLYSVKRFEDLPL